ncbi:GGDEF domain-containing phosphodiesterase [Microcoleus sp. bin38.metabat.b11b12b14.051]|uniref:sensor domain-containing protein n=1 Tax=Microcoleus sp. bin38.metabat.b11b12b14.051 TaxID=2742709 RepID=UPI0025CFA8FF|nr:GGDEF domain-containing phosphodiesterase [Microcoleus sp. bin38.metabat.b11b12b14.051]
MFQLDLFLYFEILAYFLGLSASLAFALAIYLKWQGRPPSLPPAEQDQFPQLNGDLSPKVQNQKKFLILFNSNPLQPTNNFLGTLFSIGRSLFFAQQQLPTVNSSSLVGLSTSQTLSQSRSGGIEENRDGPNAECSAKVNTSPQLEEDLLGDILAGTNSPGGAEFFDALVRHLASALAVRSAVAAKSMKSIERADTPPDRLQAISFWLDGQQQPNFECHTANTPESLVFERGMYCCQDSLGETFPQDRRPIVTGACSFLGVLLKNSYAEPLGIICIFHDRPLVQSQIAKFQLILSIFASRAAAELERQRLEAALCTVEAKYCALVEQMPAVTYISPLNRNAAKLYISPQIETFLGYSVAEWKADPDLWLKLVHPEDRDRVLVENAAQKFTGGEDIFGEAPLVSEYRAIARNGKVVWFRDRAIAVRDEGSKSVILQGAMFDITETKVAASALLESEYRYYTLAKILPVGIFRADAAGDCLYVNQRFLEMAGLTAAQALGEGWGQSLHPEDRSRVLSQWYRAVQDKLPCKLEYRFCNGNLTTWVFWQAVPEIDHSGEVLGYLGTLTDISDRKQAEFALQQAEEKYRSIFENAIEGIFQTTVDGRYLSANPALARIYGYQSAAELIANICDIDRQLYVDPSRRVEFLRAIEKHGAVSEFESQVYRADGTTIWVSENGRAVRDTIGNLLYYEGTVEDITLRKIAEEKLVHDALHDTLTGLPNRALFMDRLGHAIELSKRRPEVLFAVLFIDLDRFKVVNDSLGHLVGDRLLIAIAQRLEICLRAGDTVARLGGDEFAILLENIKNTEDAIQIAERVQAQLAEPFYLNEYQVFSSASIGIVCSGLPQNSTTSSEMSSPGNLRNIDGEPSVSCLSSDSSIAPVPLQILYDRPEELLRDADAAMYHAKGLGKARHEVFDLSMHTRAVALLQLENDLRRALDSQEFQLYYQPIVSLTSGTIVGFEALLRWYHPQRGLVSPGEFILVAEETRLIVPIGWWMMRSACHQIHQWHQKFPTNRPLTVSVNLSNEQFKQPDLIARLSEILQETQLDPRTLKLEITEGVIMDNAESAAAILSQLKNLEIELYIDDFGTGYSSLSRLHTFPTDALKIDRAFVSRMTEDEGNEAIVQTILILASHLGMDVIAEGIETIEQLNLLRALQCEYGQGYFFSKPVDSITATRLIESQPQW